ncbi:hypothetical protein DFH06DRAFT_1130552 [Mycena polygramma]|nr:hypothetical protein DFH06DRAFT_1130552 [Mycena polygramma]
MTSLQETRRLHGPRYLPHYKTNLRHRALLRKTIETFDSRYLHAIFGSNPQGLRSVMGRTDTANQLGKVVSHYKLRAYLAAYDAYFMKQGTDYVVRNPHAKAALQAAEQAWHDSIPGPRPQWALEPLPGLQRVHVAPALRGGNPVAAQVVTNFPIPRAPRPAAPALAALPPPPARGHANPAAASRGGNPVAAQVVTNFPIPRAPRTHAFPTLPSPPPATPVRAYANRAASLGDSPLRPIHILDEDQPQLVSTPRKRKFLGVVDISDDEDEDKAQEARNKEAADSRYESQASKWHTDLGVKRTNTSGAVDYAKGKRLVIVSYLNYIETEFIHLELPLLQRADHAALRIRTRRALPRPAERADHAALRSRTRRALPRPAERADHAALRSRTRRALPRPAERADHAALRSLSPWSTIFPRSWIRKLARELALKSKVLAAKSLFEAKFRVAKLALLQTPFQGNPGHGIGSGIERRAAPGGAAHRGPHCLHRSSNSGPYGIISITGFC